MKPRLAFFACALPLCLLASAARAALAPIESSRTPRGSLLLAQRDRTAPRLAISLLLRAGAADETVASAGWRRLLVDSMLQSTRDPGSSSATFLSGTQLRDRVESLGGRLTAQVGDDAIELSITGPSGRAPALLAILVAVATQPRLGDEDIDRARRALARRLSQEPGAGAEPGSNAGAPNGLGSELDASARALRRLEERLYRDASGAPVAYALAPTGTLQSLSNLDSARVRKLFSQYFEPRRRVLSLAGDFDLAALRAQAAALEAGGDWGMAPQSSPAFAPLPASPPLDVMPSAGPAASVFLSYPIEFGVLSGKEAAALQVLAAALGESPRARLPLRLSNPRKSYGDLMQGSGAIDDSSVAFAARLSAQWAPRRLRGEFVLWAQTGPQQIEAVKNALLDEVRKIRDGALTPEELRAAKNFTRGAYATDRESLRERASRNALQAAREAGEPDSSFTSAAHSEERAAWITQVEGLSARDVQQAARKYLQAYAVALVMPVN